MAKQPVNKQEAESTVFENLGMTAEELGAGDIDTGSGNEADTEAEADPGSEKVDRADTQEQPDDRRQQDTQPTQTQESVTHTQEQRRPLPKNAEVRADKNGNLVGHDGRIVARAGKEARMYVDLHKARGSVQQHEFAAQRLTTNLNRAVEIGQELQRRLEQADARMEGVSKIGLQPEQLLEAAQLFSEGQRDPIALFKKLLTRAATNGIDLTQLGIQANGGIDAKALMDMVRGELQNQMKPLRERSEQETRQQQSEAQRTESFRRTETHIQDWFGKNPEALDYIPAFRAVLSNPQFSDMSLGEIWQRIKINLMQREQQRPSNRRQPSLPNGRGGAFIPRSGDSEIASPEMTYDSILRGVMDKYYTK